MANIFDYVKKYGNKCFSEKSFNEIDNLVFSTLSYLDFSNTSIHSNCATLEIIGQEYLSSHTYKEVKKLGVAMRDAYQLLKILITQKRYQNMILSDYIYKTNQETQFCALTFHISKKLKYICFEGTDEQLSGWKEDLKLASVFPVPAHIEAINYVNKHVSLLGPDVIIGGHSKGGNLALVAGMYMKAYKRGKVQQIYSNDGPGLRLSEFYSKQYQKVKKKYTHIVPNYSIVGVLLKSDCYQVVKSSKQSIFGHAMSTWQIEDDKLVSSELSLKSKKLENNILSWVELHSDQEKAIITEHLFGAMEEARIQKTFELLKLKNLSKVIRNFKRIDTRTKSLVREFLFTIAT